MAYEKELGVALDAVRAASEVCRLVQRDLVTAGAIEKADKSPVTVADFASQAVVCARLARVWPRAVIMGEEDASALEGDGSAAELRAAVAHHAGMSEPDVLAAIDRGNADPAADTPRFWTLDPIDGTKGFLRGEQYAVALALVESGEVVLGVLGCPNLDESGLVMAAIKGEGTRRLPLTDRAGDEGEPVAVSPIDDPASARLCESVESGHSDQDASVRIAKALGITAEPYRIDSQCKYAAVARGDASIYLRLPTRPGYTEKIWDHAAGMIVVEEAGGRVSDIAGQRLDFTRGRSLAGNRGIIATNGKLHARVVEATAAVQ